MECGVAAGNNDGGMGMFYYYHDRMLHYFLSHPEPNDELKAQYLEAKLKRNKEDFLKLTEKYIIFCYHVSDAWNHERVKIDLYESGELYIITPDGTDVFRISDEQAAKIKAAVKDCSAFLKSEDAYMEMNDIYDGYHYRIVLTDGDDFYYFADSNLQEYAEDKPNGFRFKQLMIQILSMLKEMGIETDCRYVYGWLDKQRGKA